ncbi:hypothetical protein BP6252_10087 [Coleophoma cylindrospora]|uniref:Uncharacterized protein n=1 Tax=Coleophoma cylindrospora TaxID=1849047 RepID=A0A3D8QXD0_9HELO|nr:hypothetical protein BP6252_10087 [Coleophoma cylindrospora]
MNRFRTKKKAKETGDIAARPSTESDGSGILPIKTSKTWGRSRKTQEPEPKPELDLSTALPSSDDFRTSLLMSGLSARFSMLREQDDPNSKLGKASDDSVLFPSNRQSRLNDFGYFGRGGLSDIAEVSSISGSIKPPFAAMNRKDSYNTLDGYGTDDDSNNGGSIMSRAKPGEGNNLFGGRQKIYKIAGGATSTKSMGEGGSLGGKILYDDDVAQSAFQKLRERERAEERMRKAHEEQEREEAEQRVEDSRPSSPPLTGYNRNRETSSTTSSGPNARMSTAATSVTSQRTPSLKGHNTSVPGTPALNTSGLERSGTKGRRLYETGLDKDLHEQQFSAMSRIDTLARQRTLGAHTPPPGLASPTSATSTGAFDRFDRQPVATQSSMPNLRAASPPPIPAAAAKFDFGIKPAALEPKSMASFASPALSPPLSPPMSEDDNGQFPVQPADIGKATASLAFSKPVQPYDDNKYSQRQIQMQQGREDQPFRKHSPPEAFTPRQQPSAPRSRADSSATLNSGASVRSGPNSLAQRTGPMHERFATKPKSEIKVPENHAITAAGTFLTSPDVPSSPDDFDMPPSKPWDRAGAQSPSIPKGYRPDPSQSPILECPPESQHPANRELAPVSPIEVPLVDRVDMIMGNVNPNRLSTGDLSKIRPKSPHAEDSPTLGPTTGLSGMVRQHLRSDSNNSSIYGVQSAAPSAAFASRFPQDHTEPVPQHDYSSTKSNPWDLDDWDQQYQGENKENSLYGQVSAPAPLTVKPARTETSAEEKPAWEQELANHHARMGSTETQIERQELADDLAFRRKQVQEKMKSFVETDSRSNSPLPGMDWARQNNPLGILKAKTSRTSLSVKTQREKEPVPSKTMKMLGLGNATMNSSPSPNSKVFEEDAWKQEEEEMLRGVPKPRVGSETKAFRQARRDVQRTREQDNMRYGPAQGRRPSAEREWTAPPAIQTRGLPRQNDPNRERGPAPMHTGPRIGAPGQERGPMQMGPRARAPSRDRHPPPVSQNPRRQNGSSRDSHDSESSSRTGSRPPSRDRSSSDASGGRSKSRNGRYRDDIAKAMGDGMGSSAAHNGYEAAPVSARSMPKSPAQPGMNYQPSHSPAFLPSPAFPVSPAMPSPAPGPDAPFRARSRTNSKAGYFDQNLAPGQTSEEIGLSPRPSPVAPFVVNPTPPIEHPSPLMSSTTPTGAGFQSNGRITAARKKSINKSDISEPTLISSTSRITTVNLPPGSSLSNGAEPSPPIPPINPRRRQTRVQTMFGAFASKKEDAMPSLSLQQATQSTDEMSTFSADEADKVPRHRQKLRKSSSEGGNLNSIARQQAMAMPSPAMPAATFPRPEGRSPSPPKVEGGMF